MTVTILVIIAELMGRVGTTLPGLESPQFTDVGRENLVLLGPLDPKAYGFDGCKSAK